MEFGSPQFWLAGLEIIVINILLSGDNAVVIALACRNLLKRGTIKTNPILSEVAAVSVGIIDGTPILDLDDAVRCPV